MIVLKSFLILASHLSKLRKNNWLYDFSVSIDSSTWSRSLLIAPAIILFPRTLDKPFSVLSTFIVEDS